MTVPSRSPPIVDVLVPGPRPWPSATMFSLRVSIQRTGRPTSRASQATRTSSGSAPTLAPKPPPTSGTRTRTCAASMPESAGELVARGVRRLGRRPVREAAVLAPRGDGDAALHRARGEPLAVKRRRDDDLAAVEQRRRRGSRAGTRAQTFVPTSGNSSASSASAVRGRRPPAARHVDDDALGRVGALEPRSSVSTTATISPTNRATSRAITGRGMPLFEPRHRDRQRRRARRPRAVNARAPGISATGARVDAGDPARAARIERTNVACSAPWRVDVVAEGRRAGDEPRVLAARDPVAEDAHGRRTL